MRTGIHGLTMLKTYRDVHPDATIVVLDKGTSIGGVWAKDRLYPGLHTNNHFRTFVPHLRVPHRNTDKPKFRSTSQTVPKGPRHANAILVQRLPDEHGRL
jgi:cation diffusion facilitator CzcD-associated flavoprotein CzcO